MTSLTGAGEVPKIAFEYWSWCETMAQWPGLYGMDQKRSDCHDRLCQRYGITKEASKAVTDHLSRYQDAVEMHFALMDLKK